MKFMATVTIICTTSPTQTENETSISVLNMEEQNQAQLKKVLWCYCLFVGSIL